LQPRKRIHSGGPPAEAEHVGEEAQRRGIVGDRKHHMPEPHHSGDKTVSVRAARRTMLKRGGTEHLMGVARRIIEAQQLPHSALGQLCGSACLGRDACLLQRLSYLG
jgi:hypothetical protein